jgi:hypothetical protein
VKTWDPPGPGKLLVGGQEDMIVDVALDMLKERAPAASDAVKKRAWTA